MAKIEFSLTPKERRLVLKHGYPFDDFEKALRDSQDDPGLVQFELSEYYFDHLLGELARSINHSTNRRLQLELNEIYERLENDRMADDQWL